MPALLPVRGGHPTPEVPMPLIFTTGGYDRCVICGTNQTEGIYLSRCCCDSDFICEKCCKQKRLHDYLIRTLGPLDQERKL